MQTETTYTWSSYALRCQECGNESGLIVNESGESVLTCGHAPKLIVESVV